MNTARDFLVSYEQALSRQDWTSIDGLIHEKCAVTFSEGTYLGKQEVETAFKRAFSLIKNEIYKIRNLRVIQEAETFAVFVFEFDWTGRVEGRNASGSGRGTSVLCKENDRWQLLCEHLGPAAPV